MGPVSRPQRIKTISLPPSSRPDSARAGSRSSAAPARFSSAPASRPSWIERAKFERTFTQECQKTLFAAFAKGELDSFLSNSVELEKCPGLLESDPIINRNRTATLWQALNLSREADETFLSDHIINVFRSLRRIHKAGTLPHHQLAELLRLRGEGLEQATADFEHLSTLLAEVIFRPEDRAFIVGTLCHDFGKLIKHNIHAAAGAQLFPRLAGLGELLPTREEREFARLVIRYHSILGDIFGLREQHPRDLFPLLKIRDPGKRARLFKALYLFSVADLDAIGARGRLTYNKFAELRQGYQILAAARDSHHLKALLEAAGFGEISFGQNRWERWVNRGDRTAPKPAPETLRQLGTLGEIRKIDSLTRQIGSAKLRARLVTWLAQFAATHPRQKNFSFELNYKTPAKSAREIDRLQELLSGPKPSKLHSTLKLVPVKLPGSKELTEIWLKP